MKIFIILFIFFDLLNAVFLDINYNAKKSTNQEYDEFEPVTTLSKSLDGFKNINCDDFTSYSANCTIDAALIYNSSKMSPPLPSKINDWCRAIKHLTNCAINWNTDCKDVTDSHFNEESIKGHIHVVNNICDDEWYHIRYEDVAVCIESAMASWEECYMKFKNIVEEQKNSTREWTHYEVHFQLCCARARFRRCTLETLFIKPTHCSQEQAVTLQKFSVIVSEGGVYQDCERNMMYSNCPNGDPRPTTTMLKQLMNAEAHSRGAMLNSKTWIFNLFYIKILYKLFIF